MKASVLFAVGALLGLALIVPTGFVVLSKDRPAGGLQLESLPTVTRHAYELAVERGDLFVHMPCYCGCALLAKPHESLRDCFINPSGQFDTHASSCSTCVDIALEVEAASDEGLSHAEISRLVDTLFAARGPRTPTQGP
jgi:hypothetical protein